jgi:hypothetical protein
MMPEAAPHRQLPVVLPPAADELLSSWISRHAAFYGVPPIIMLRHCLPEATSLHAADLHLSDEQARHLSKILATEPETLRRMTFANVAQTSRRLIATRPLQCCSNCMSANGEPTPIMRSQLLGWRITCLLCRGPLHDCDDCEVPSPFRHYLGAALRGEKLLDAEAERGVRTWASPIDIARLLLMRRDPRTLRPEKQIGSPRILGVVVPELEAVVADSRISLPSPANPILQLSLRPALLVGIAIVERAGPAMLEMLHAHTIGENRTRFGRLIDHVLAQNHTLSRPTQLQLI